MEISKLNQAYDCLNDYIVYFVKLHLKKSNLNKVKCKKKTNAIFQNYVYLYIPLLLAFN